MKKSGIIIAVIAVLVVAVVVIIIAASKGPGTTTTPGSTTKTEAIEEEKLDEISNDIKGISGKILSIKDNVVVISALISMKDPSAAPISHNTALSVNEQTTITKVVLPSPEKMMGSTEPITPKKTPLKFNDLKIGDLIDVRTSVNIYDSLKSNTPFNASMIDVIVYE